MKNINQLTDLVKKQYNETSSELQALKELLSAQKTQMEQLCQQMAEKEEKIRSLENQIRELKLQQQISDVERETRVESVWLP